MKNEHIISHPEGCVGMGGRSPKRRQLSLFVRIGSVFAGSPNFPIWELTSSGSDCHPHSTGGGDTLPEVLYLRMRFLCHRTSTAGCCSHIGEDLIIIRHPRQRVPLRLLCYVQHWTEC